MVSTVETDRDANMETTQGSGPLDLRVTDMDEATAMLIDRTRLPKRWCEDHPEHEQRVDWCNDVLYAAFYVSAILLPIGRISLNDGAAFRLTEMDWGRRRWIP